MLVHFHERGELTPEGLYLQVAQIGEAKMLVEYPACKVVVIIDPLWDDAHYGETAEDGGFVLRASIHECYPGSS
jgi:hypothetical protein